MGMASEEASTIAKVVKKILDKGKKHQFGRVTMKCRSEVKGKLQFSNYLVEIEVKQVSELAEIGDGGWPRTATGLP